MRNHVIRINNFNVMVAAAIEANVLNFGETVYGEPEALTLSWYSAVPLIGEDGYGLINSVGTQAGTLTDGSSAMWVGPGELTYDFSAIYDGTAGDLLLLGGDAILVVSDSYSGFEFGSSALADGQLGGLVSQDAMVSFMRGLIPVGFCNPKTAECTEFSGIAGTLDDLEAAYSDEANAGLWGYSVDGDPATAVGFGWSAESAILVEDFEPSTGE